MALAPELRSTLRYLATHEMQESKELDFKEEFHPDGPQAKGAWCEIVKDVAAFANIGGGVIVFGCDSFGIPSSFQVETLAKLDPARITDQMNKYVGEHFSSFSIEKVQRGSIARLAWLIGPVDSPMIFTEDAYFRQGGGFAAPAFHKGQVYFRHGAKSEPGTPLDMKEFIERHDKSGPLTLGAAINRPESLVALGAEPPPAGPLPAGRPTDVLALAEVLRRAASMNTDIQAAVQKNLDEVRKIWGLGRKRVESK